MCEDVNFLTTLIDSISKEKSFSFIIRECAKKRQMWNEISIFVIKKI